MAYDVYIFIARPEGGEDGMEKDTMFELDLTLANIGTNPKEVGDQSSIMYILTTSSSAPTSCHLFLLFWDHHPHS